MEEQSNVKNTICMSRQCLRNGAKALILLGFLDGSVELEVKQVAIKSSSFFQRRYEMRYHVVETVQI